MRKIDLGKYNDKLVRITASDGNSYEGHCYYNGREYNYHELGVDEDSLQIVCFVFYKSTIKEVVCIDKFSDKYGLLEKEALEDGTDLVDEFFDSEEDEHILRLLLCMKDNYNNHYADKDKLILELKSLIKYNKNRKVIEEAKELLNMVRKNNE